MNNDPKAQETAEKEPGQVAFEAYYTRSGIFGTWVNTTANERREWAAIEQAVLEAAGLEKLRKDMELIRVGLEVPPDVADTHVYGYARAARGRELAAEQRIRELEAERDKIRQALTGACVERQEYKHHAEELEAEKADVHHKLYTARGELEDMRLRAEKAERERDSETKDRQRLHEVIDSWQRDYNRLANRGHLLEKALKAAKDVLVWRHPGDNIKDIVERLRAAIDAAQTDSPALRKTPEGADKPARSSSGAFVGDVAPVAENTGHLSGESAAAGVRAPVSGAHNPTEAAGSSSLPGGPGPRCELTERVEALEAAVMGLTRMCLAELKITPGWRVWLRDSLDRLDRLEQSARGEKS